MVTVPITVRAGTTGILKRDGAETAFASAETMGEPGNTQNNALQSNLDYPDSSGPQ